MGGADKRVFPRFAVQLAAELEARGGQPLRGIARNLSRGGICLETVDPVSVGEDVTVRVTLVFDADRTSEPLELPARVVWCTPLGGSHQIGTQFRPLSQDRASYLDMFVRYLEQHASPGPDGDDGGAVGGEDDPFAA